METERKISALLLRIEAILCGGPAFIDQKLMGRDSAITATRVEVDMRE